MNAFARLYYVNIMHKLYLYRRERRFPYVQTVTLTLQRHRVQEKNPPHAVPTQRLTYWGPDNSQQPPQAHAFVPFRDSASRFFPYYSKHPLKEEGSGQRVPFSAYSPVLHTDSINRYRPRQANLAQTFLFCLYKPTLPHEQQGHIL